MRNDFHPGRVFAAACAGMLLFGVSLITVGAISIPLGQRFSLDPVAVGTLFSILPIGILSGSLLFGPFCDRYGYRLLLAVSCLLLFAGLQGIARATDMAALRLLIFTVGLSGGALNGATNAVVSDISTGNKGANLSLLGVFFALGVTGIPLILSVMHGRYGYPVILSVVGVLPLAVAAACLLVRFPAPKASSPIAPGTLAGLAGDRFLLLIAFFLFFQSGVETLINNWSTRYLMEAYGVTEGRALFILSLYVVGMAVMRVLMGTVFRETAPRRIMQACIAFALVAVGMLRYGRDPLTATIAVVLAGAGMAGGYPVMLGLAGARFSELSGTAFSIILFIALSGNMCINYVMGRVTAALGVGHYTTLAFLQIALMAAMMALIFKAPEKNPRQT